MKTRTFVSILIFILAVLIASSCATTPKTQEEKEGIPDKVFLQAVISGDIAEVKRLIEEGADVNAQNYYGETALMFASNFGYTEVAQLLIEEGADVNAGDDEGMTALMKASIRGKTKVAKLLIEEGADINVQDKWGYTALKWALIKGHEEIATLLREASAKE